jgi:hypothetical protein
MGMRGKEKEVSLGVVQIEIQIQIGGYCGV